MRRLTWIAGAACLALCGGAEAVAKTFAEDNGLVSMEAENATIISGWKEVSGMSGSAMEDVSSRNGGSLKFEITFSSTGKFYVFMLGHCANPCSETNDAYFTLDGERLYGSDDSTRPEGMRLNCSSFCWSFLPKGPGGSTPTNIKSDPVYFKVSSAGTKTLKVGSRSEEFVLDKLVLQLNDQSKPSGSGPAETDGSGGGGGGGGGTNTAPTSTILAPSGGLSYQAGEAIAYSGWGSDTEDGTLTSAMLVWEYDLQSDGDGALPIGTGANGTFTAPTHPAGMYPYTLTIMLTATDSAGLTAETSVQVTVDQADSTPPSISFSGLRVGGFVDDESLQSVTVDGASVPLIGSAFNADVTAGAAAGGVSITATDVAGNSSTRTLTVSAP